jgi:hypothetical protein
MIPVGCVLGPLVLIAQIYVMAYIIQLSGNFVYRDSAVPVTEGAEEYAFKRGWGALRAGFIGLIVGQFTAVVFSSCFRVKSAASMNVVLATFLIAGSATGFFIYKWMWLRRHKTEITLRNRSEP